MSPCLVRVRVVAWWASHASPCQRGARLLTLSALPLARPQVLFTGGGAWFLNHTNHTIHDGQLTPYAATGKLLFDLVMDANLKQGRYVPLWGACALCAHAVGRGCGLGLGRGGESGGDMCP